MKAPQIIILVLLIVELLLVSYLHGKEKSGNYNFWSTLISTSIIIGLLVWGGFFNN
jgi:heme/copper-type cytochrome/quinol oxidase subunit 4